MEGLALSLDELTKLLVTMQEPKSGKGLCPFLIRFLKALFASPQPWPKPVGKQSQIEQAALSIA
ncbi:hypothetical protein IX91_25950 (plasmid) [Vibrio tubiashii ATCC 19109]|uniref:Uncharacterized protein n=1 Tax=Vibrio tubiashii ATCC 19109 TaxID=1051646 RepID=F9T6U0_9VIBR|nr:hypothetical protein IX91_25950 [Vibrio tubiashii ATCC 19109]EGU54495.1 hypothetical protein VITU9109_02937 [Vibrio tubiashii ATCC 19109]EIF01274.1 hypothetical protein VT1337_24350 [Vibrio tubiashii NCIMB 1337 = ATCC 19106]